MKKSKSKSKRPVKRYAKPNSCPYCKGAADPSYKDYKKLTGFLTARSAITPSKYSGVCSYHQRLLSREIKRARSLGLLPYLPVM
jgi:small subunit ribosomal protein S18